DANGLMWGTTTYGGSKDCGTVFKLDPATAKITTVVHFTASGGSAPGKSPRGHLIADSKGGAIGVCEYGGHGFLGTVYRIDLTTSRFKLLTDISGLENANEGSQPQGGLASGSDGWLWGTASMNGSHHGGTVFKVDPVTNTLVSVANFTGNTGPQRGKYPCATLHNDGNGFLWGTTREGGLANYGTVFKVNEATGELSTVLDFKVNGNTVRGGTRSELIPDGKGWLWSCTYSTWFQIMGVVYKINTRTNEIVVINKFDGDKGPLFGRGPGVLAYDGNGFMWGAAMADHQRSRGSLFKIDVNTNKRTTLAEFLDCEPGPGFQSMGDMHIDRRGSLWFTAVIDGGSRNAGHALVKVNPSTGRIEGRYRERGFADISAPVSDEQGTLWGATASGGEESRGSIYAFDPKTEKFSTVMSFTGNGSQPNSGSSAHFSKLMKHTDGNFYAVTRFGGPGGNGTVYRLRFGPTPMTQEASLLANKRVELHGTLRPNGRESAAAFEWGTDASLKQAQIISAGNIVASHSSKPVSATLSGLKPGMTYYFRLRGTNAANSIPQRGAILSFTAPQTESTLAGGKTTEKETPFGQIASLTQSGKPGAAKHSLKVVRIPGAGAGFVRGALDGAAYEIGKRYTLRAVADNGYVFDHWSGPDISGAQAENPSLSFTYSEAMAGTPVITATFIRNPFQDEVVGRFQGLIINAESLTPDISNTGAAHFSVTRSGSFSGKLLYDSDTISLTGKFDSGGLARFGQQHLPSLLISRKDMPTLVLSMQVDLSNEGPHEVCGTIGTTEGGEVAERSFFNADRGYYDGRRHAVPDMFVSQIAGHELTLTTLNQEETNARLIITSSGNATFVTKLSDGTGILAHGPISQLNQAVFFNQLYARRIGSFGGQVTLSELLASQTLTDQPFWWSYPNHGWENLNLFKQHQAP
ncbi:MAG: choice-of-anchor tandem repeat GloVer-containing protein, partial [Prosthecobacter sp.]